MKSIRILKETTNHWKGVSAGTVIAMMNEEDADSVIKNGEGELVDQGTATSLHLREISDKLMDIDLMLSRGDCREQPFEELGMHEKLDMIYAELDRITLKVNDLEA
jgi:hypothetical protein